ncbi:hypothetical protein DNH61_14685 [Paenibacillus sambharensis]|uniref:Uncharacterized protein n=1 Tax=Paenibacillus sambharensis TaxID=1803190 RepID=A0A2W1L8H2_9BACL|nr:hypothetical protein [Paenibacillus sambharensis]PZD95129.1 hypothetical protein DNH61_14685 [Paenibacillus sambharensis]
MGKRQGYPVTTAFAGLFHLIVCTGDRCGIGTCTVGTRQKPFFLPAAYDTALLLEVTRHKNGAVM